MKKLMMVYILMLIVCTGTNSFCQDYSTLGSTANASSANQINAMQNQNMQGQGYGYGEGGKATATGGNSTSNSESIALSGDSGAIANISTNSTSNYQTRTPPVAMFPPYLPTFQHGGWGTMQGYFPNGPISNDRMYERAFYPGSKYDMKELKGSIKAIPYDGPLGLLDGLLNNVGSLLGCPDNFAHGRGFEISSSIVRKRRPKDRPLYILIDSNINRDYLNKTGYLYIGKISLEGKVERNWDQVYKAAIAEALPWDIDIILVSGGMKGVTVGTNFTFPTAGAAYAQTNYSLTLLGGTSTGMTEGKGKAMVSAECYRYYPQAAQSRAIPEAFYERIHATTNTVSKAEPARQTQIKSNVTVSQKKEPAKAETAQAR